MKIGMQNLRNLQNLREPPKAPKPAKQGTPQIRNIPASLAPSPLEGSADSGPTAKCKHFATGPLSKTKGSVTGSVNKTK